MRRWLLLVLLVFLPLQFTSAAIAGYCLHETDTLASHIGHHEHEHQSPSGDVAASDAGSTQQSVPSGAADVDCGYCHLTCAQPLASAQVVGFIAARHALSSHYAFVLDTRDPDRLDRPNWPLAS